MSYATPQDVISRLPWDASEITDTTFLSTGDIQGYLDEASALLAPVVSVAAGLASGSLDATTIAQLRSAECDYAVFQALSKMQLGAGELASRAWERWLHITKKYESATHMLNAQSGTRTLTTSPTDGRASQFSGRSYRGF